jgi:hypothetical protein
MPHLFAGSVWSTRKIFIFTLRSFILEAAPLLSGLNMTPHLARRFLLSASRFFGPTG